VNQDSEGSLVASIAGLKNGLKQASTEAEKALTQLAALDAQVDQAIAMLTAVTGGYSQPALMKAIGSLQAAKQKFAEGGTAIRSAIAATDHYNSAI
jgi:hypothetical protein